MGFDSISSNVPFFSRQKRTNSLAKLKQSKLDVRREQWLSQVKNKGCSVDPNMRSEPFSPPIQMANEVNKSLISLEVMSDVEALSVDEIDLESLTSSHSGSSLGLNDSSKSHGGSSRSSTSSRCYSGCISEEEGNDGSLDDWEAIADALNAADNQRNTASHSIPKQQSVDHNAGANFQKSDLGVLHPTSCQALMPDDGFRTQTLPKQNSDVCCGHGVVNWAWQGRISSPPSSCPICCEDLDATDTSFLPCSCGFRLCLFCHNRILEEDARCPGCRKQYIA